MGSYCPVCNQFVGNLDVCDGVYGPEFHIDDKVQTRSKSKQHRSSIITGEILKILNRVEAAPSKIEKVKLFENILIIFNDNKWILKNNKKLSDVIILKINEFSSDSPEFRYLASFKYQLFD
jgi:hypothetical protein